MEQNKIWDYYQTEEIGSFDGSYGRLNFLISKCKNKKVLNIGIGGGIFEKLAVSNNINIYSLDPSKKSIKKIKEVIKKDKAKVGFSQDIPFKDNFFDIIVMSEVLEHLEMKIIQQTLSEINRILKKNGKFIGTVPYDENLKEQLVVCPKCGEKFHRWGHVQSFDKNRLNKLLSTEFTQIYLKSKMFISWNILNWKGKISTTISYLFYLIGIKKSGLNLYFEAYKS